MREEIELVFFVLCLWLFIKQTDFHSKTFNLEKSLHKYYQNLGNLKLSFIFISVTSFKFIGTWGISCARSG